MFDIIREQPRQQNLQSEIQEIRKDDKEKPGTWYNFNFTQKGKPSAKSYDSESTKLSKASGNLMKLTCPPQGQGPES